MKMRKYTQKERDYLKYLLFNDAWLMREECCMNHNAMDRSTMYDCWKADIDDPDKFEDWFESQRRRYNERRANGRGVDEFMRPYDFTLDLEEYAKEYAKAYIDKCG